MVAMVRDGCGCRCILFVLFMDFAVSTKRSEAFFFSILPKNRHKTSIIDPTRKIKILQPGGN